MMLASMAERKQYRSHLSAKLKNNYEITKYLAEKVEYVPIFQPKDVWFPIDSSKFKPVVRHPEDDILCAHRGTSPCYFSFFVIHVYS
jgi:hypothetical protein